MRVKPSTEDWAVARRVYRAFARKPGSGHIASEVALAHVAAVVRVGKIKSVLEFGAGIGTVTYLLLDCLPKDRTLVSTEHDPFCRDQLARNLPADMRQGFRVLCPHEKEGSESFDLVIVDGKLAKTQMSDYLRPGSICFIEGDRARTRTTIHAGLAKRTLFCDFEYHSRRAKRLDWRKSSFGLSYPRVNLSLTPTRGCWIGEVSPAPPA